MKRLRIHEHFASLEDPRVERRKLHALMDVVILALLAVIAGAEGWNDMEDFGEVRREWLETFLRLRNGIPSADTFRRVFEALDPAEFQRGFVAWMNELCEDLHGKLVSIDVKTARGSFAKERGQGPLHLVSAWVQENALVLAQFAVEDKSNEIVALPKLLELLEVRGATVTIDAIGCQKKIAAEIVGKVADYVLALVDHPPTLCEDVRSFFAHAQAAGWKDTPHAFDETADKGHGRIEVRRVWASEASDWLDPKREWKGLRSVVMVERVRSIGDETSTEHAYYITRHASEAASLSAQIRGHGSIENTLHWPLDVTFHEDSSRIRSKNGVQNLAALRKLALALLKRDTSMPKLSVARKRKRAAHLNEYALSVLCGTHAGSPS